MPVTDVKEIRILPPLAIGRFGSSAEPMHNYDAVIAPGTGYRELRPAETLMLDPSTGEIVAKLTPSTIRFKDGAGRVKPVCPFLEVWARFDNETELRPLTLSELADLQRGPEHISWDVTFANLKVLRRTGEPSDRVEAHITGITTHEARLLQGRCANFKPDRFIAFGSVQYIKPTTAFPEIRMRVTAPAGLVYGHTADAVIPPQNAVYDRTRGTWDTHSDSATPTGSPDPRAHISTVPTSIYARSTTTRRNLGYLDDACDGIVAATLTLRDGRRLSSFARASAGPPDYAPDSDPVRSMQDELEQMVFGPTAQNVSAGEVLDIVRRALETMRLMNTDVWNAAYSNNAFQPSMAAYATAHGIHSGLLDTLAKGLAAPPDSAERQAAHGTLQRINAVLREYDAIGDQRAEARRRMPALMRGADGNDLALNRRRRSQLRKAVEVFQPQSAGSGSPEMVAMIRMIGNFSGVAVLHARFSEDGVTLADRFSDPPKVLEYLRKAVAKGDVATAAGIAGQPLVVPGDPANSAFLRTISRPEHPMNGPLSSYKDSTSGKTGLQVVADWITSLGAGV
jgi:hypothetical protein